MTDAQTLEFDHFGPWVLEITPMDPLPRVFLAYVARRDEPILAVKIPRRIERRDAHPGMDLYDYLICLYPDDIEILQRDDHEVRRWACPYRDIRQLRITRSLLRGNVHVGITGGACDLPFDTTADGPIDRVVRLIRDHYQRPLVKAPAQRPDPSPAGLSFYFRHLLAAARREDPALQPLALQATVALGSRGATTVRRWLYGAAGKHLLESMHLSDGRELVIVDRGARYAYRWDPVFGQATTYIPLDAIRRVSWAADAGSRIVTVAIGTDGGTFSYAFVEDDACVEGYRMWLSDLMARATSASTLPGELPSPSEAA